MHSMAGMRELMEQRHGQAGFTRRSNPKSRVGSARNRMRYLNMVKETAVGEKG